MMLYDIFEVEQEIIIPILFGQRIMKPISKLEQPRTKLERQDIEYVPGSGTVFLPAPYIEPYPLAFTKEEVREANKRIRPPIIP